MSRGRQNNPIEPIMIDPLNPAPGHEAILLELLWAEEKKHAKKAKGKKFLQQKEWLAYEKVKLENGLFRRRKKVYRLEDGRSVSLLHDISRSPKRYGRVVILGEKEPMPENDEAGNAFIKAERKESGFKTIYLKEKSDGTFRVRAGKKSPEDLDERKSQELSRYLASLNDPQTIQKNLDDHFDLYQAKNKFYRALKAEDDTAEQNAIQDIERLTKKIKDKRKEISRVQKICGYTGYSYTITSIPDDGESLGVGSAGSVNDTQEKFSIFKDANGLRLERKARKNTQISKYSHLEGRNAHVQLSAENELNILDLPEWQDIFATKTPTIQKDADGNVVSIRFVQRKAKGHELQRLSLDDKDDKDWRAKKNIAELTDEERLKVIPYLLKALIELRKTGIVHRDVKLENFMLERKPDGEMEVTFIDFGFARLITRPDGRYLGTPLVMPPEVAVEQGDDVQSDDYSLGMAIRDLLNDEIIWKHRYKIFNLQEGKYRDKFLTAEYFLNISARKPVCPILDEREEKGTEEQKTQAKELKEILYEMTLPSKGGRLSAEMALLRYEDALGNPVEDKVWNEEIQKQNTSAPVFDFWKGYDALEKIEDRATLLYFLDSAWMQLKEYKDTPGIDSESKEFLKKCYALRDQQEGLTIDIIPAIAALVSRALYNEKYSQNSSEKRDEIYSQLKKAVIHYYPPLAPKRNFIEYLKDALNETYLRSMSPKKRQKTNFLAHFMGWPGGKGAGAWVGYVFFGFLLTPLKNILKTVELAAKCVSQTFKFIQERFGRFQPTNTAVRFIYNFTWAIFCFLPYVAAALAAWAISAVTSPMANYRAGLDKEHFGAPALASAVVTVFAYAAIMVAAAPLIALIAAKLGFGATVKSVGEAVSGISTLSDITTPVAWTAAHTGAVSAAGEAFISTATAAFLAVRGMVASFLEKCFDGEKVSYSRTVKPKVTGGSSNGSRLSSSTASISRNMSFVPSVNVSEEKRNSLDGEREPLVVPTQAPQPRRELGSYHSVSSGPR